MKKIIVLGLILLGFSSSPFLVSADIIPANMHRIDRCSYISNLSDFPNIYVLKAGFYAGGGEGGSISIVKTDTCLTGRSSGSFWSKYFIVNKIYFDSIEKENFKIDSMPEKDIIELETNFAGPYSSNASSLKKETIYYSLVKDSEGKYILQKDDTISEYSNVIRNKIETIINPENEKVVKEVKKEVEPVVKKEIEKDKDVPFEGDDIVNPQQDMIKKGFWQKVKCFFSFSKNC